MRVALVTIFIVLVLAADVSITHIMLNGPSVVPGLIITLTVFVAPVLLVWGTSDDRY